MLTTFLTKLRIKSQKIFLNALDYDPNRRDIKSNRSKFVPELIKSRVTSSRLVTFLSGSPDELRDRLQSFLQEKRSGYIRSRFDVEFVVIIDKL